MKKKEILIVLNILINITFTFILSLSFVKNIFHSWISFLSIMFFEFQIMFNFIFFTDFGVLQSWKCNKTFKLNPEYDPDDIHYLNTDGFLHVIDQEPYDPNNYCVKTLVFIMNFIQCLFYMIYKTQ